MRNINFLTYISNNPSELQIYGLERALIYIHALCVRAAKALTRLRICAVSSGPSLVACAINANISCTGSFNQCLIKPSPKSRTLITITRNLIIFLSQGTVFTTIDRVQIVLIISAAFWKSSQRLSWQSFYRLRIKRLLG